MKVRIIYPIKNSIYKKKAYVLTGLSYSVIFFYKVDILTTIQLLLHFEVGTSERKSPSKINCNKFHGSAYNHDNVENF